MRPLLAALSMAAACACPGADFDRNPASRLSDAEKPAWQVFSAGIATLAGEGDRKQAAALFEEVATKFPSSTYAADSKDLARALRRMLEEEKNWKEPAEPEKLPLEQEIAYYIHHLRDVNCQQYMQPGMCHLLEEYGQVSPETNAAIKLKKIGEPAIPALIGLLEDRRPTRSVGYWRAFHPSRTVLRYQDAATQILNALLPAPFYRPLTSSSYFSTEDPEVQARVIRSIKSWYQDSLGKSEVEKKWFAVEAEPGIYPMLDLLRSLAAEPGQTERVLSTLRQQCAKRHALQLPLLSELMCELGDYTKVDESLSVLLAGKFSVVTSLPDDSAPGSNAQDAVLRQVVLYGTDAQRDALVKGLQPHTVFAILVPLAAETWRKLPRSYGKDRFPMHLLVSYLSDKEEYSYSSRGSEKWSTRRCDKAAEAIEHFTGQKFGYDEEKSEKERDEAIARILAWWEERSGNASLERGKD